MKVIYTYDVQWEESDTPWSTRWEQYIKGNPEVRCRPSVLSVEIVTALLVHDCGILTTKRLRNMS